MNELLLNIHLGSMDIDDEEQIADISRFVVDLRNGELYIPPGTISSPIPSSNQSRKKIAYLVVDTNFILSHLELLSDLEILLHDKYKGMYQIVIPKQVVHELDGLKEAKRMIDSTHSIAKLARNAINWCYEHFHDSIPTVTGQRLHERVDKSAEKDNAILDCCLYFQNVENGGGNLVILMSDDKNLCVKSLVNNVLTISYRTGMTAELIAENVVNELRMNYQYREPPEQQVATETADYYNDTEMNMEDDSMIAESEVSNVPGDPVETIYSQVTMLVLESISYAIRYIYEDETDLVDYKDSEMKNLKDAGRFIIRYSFSIFGDFFTRSKSPLKALERNFAKYTSIPYHDVKEVKDFITFWGDFLDGIYESRTDEQKAALMQIKENWNMLISKL